MQNMQSRGGYARTSIENRWFSGYVELGMGTETRYLIGRKRPEYR